MKALYFNLLGIFKNPKNLPKSESIRRFTTKKGREQASIRFQPDGDFFMSPVKGVSESNVDFFLVEVVNTFGGSRMVARVGKEDRSREPYTDSRSGKQMLRLSGGAAATLVRVHNTGKVEMLRVSSPIVNNRKTIEVFSLFEGNLPFENEAVFKAVVTGNETLSQFAEDIRQLHKQAASSKPRERRPFERRDFDLSQAKANLVKSQDNAPKKVELEDKPESKLKLKPKPKPKPRKDETEVKARKRAKIQKTKARDQEDRNEILETLKSKK